MVRGLWSCLGNVLWGFCTFPSSMGLSLMWTTGPGWVLVDLGGGERERDNERKIEVIEEREAERR